jgi:hyperosmotically inducible periplasmic protein
MKKSFLRFSAIVLIASSSVVGIQSCKSGPKDADIQTAIETQSASYPGLSATVKDGVATLSGTATDEAAKTGFENAVKGVKGVKSVVNNITVAPPAATAPVEITADDPLSQGLTDATKDFPSVKATVSDGVVTLTGSLKRSQLPALMKSINSLKPKKIDNKLTLE